MAYVGEGGEGGTAQKGTPASGIWKVRDSLVEVHERIIILLLGNLSFRPKNCSQQQSHQKAVKKVNLTGKFSKK